MSWRLLRSWWARILLVVAAGLAVLLGTACGPRTGGSGGMLYSLRKCETGNNYGMHTWVGGIEYGGAYGFNVRLWRAMGYRPDPEYAPASLQDSVEMRIISQMGVHRTNPGCAARLGL
jgi:hypothetical protein